MNPLQNDNVLKLGLFSTNADGGLAFTTVGERWRARWDDIETMARLADAAGFEFILPIARWKGYGGETDVRGTSFETLTHAAAFAAITKRIAIFSTVHVPLVHPVFAAKALATIDHVSKGRAGLNIVCGWNQAEFDMFGHRQSQHDDRYEQGMEWFEIMLGIFIRDRPFDYTGRFYDLKGVVGSPRPVQTPRPLTMSAAFSPAGRRFAARTSDVLFTPLREPEKAVAHIAEFQELAAAVKRKVSVFTACHVVCRETTPRPSRIIATMLKKKRMWAPSTSTWLPSRRTTARLIPTSSASSAAATRAGRERTPLSVARSAWPRRSSACIVWDSPARPFRS
jgi:dimethylsulfone monooxygenase